MDPGAHPLACPGFQVWEQRRQTASKGGIAILVRRGLVVERSEGNEYAQVAQIKLPDSTRLYVVNVYLPPAYNLQQRGVVEQEARDSVGNILATVPPGAHIFVAGDWNTRTGSRVPTVGGDTLARCSADSRVCNRAPWLMELLSVHGLYLLNGLQPGPEAGFTCLTAAGSSVVDYVATRDPGHRVDTCPATLEGLSDHLLLHLQFTGAAHHLGTHPRPSHTPGQVYYKWVEGEKIGEYAESGQKWA